MEKRLFGRELFVDGQVIGEIVELDREIHVFDGKPPGSLNVDGSEIQNGADVGLDQPVGHFLGLGGGRGDDSDFHAADFLDFREQVDVLHHQAAGQLLADLVGVDVKSGDEPVTLSTEIFVSYKGRPQVADAYEPQAPFLVQAENLLDLEQKVSNVVSDSPDPELAEISQVFAYMG